MSYNFVDKEHAAYMSVTSAATRTGDGIDTAYASSLSIHASIATNVDTAGTFTIEIYNTAAAGWDTYAGSSSTVTAGVVYSQTWEISPVVAKIDRVKFTRTAGTSDAIVVTYTRRRGA